MIVAILMRYVDSSSGDMLVEKRLGGVWIFKMHDVAGRVGRDNAPGSFCKCNILNLLFWLISQTIILGCSRRGGVTISNNHCSRNRK